MIDKRRVGRRKRHVQVEMLDASGTKQRSSRGGKRRGAGRPPKGERAGAPHKRRLAFKASEPIHVVLRVVKAVGSLRRRKMYQALRGATQTTVRREDFRIIHISIQRTHVHLLVEVDPQFGVHRLVKAIKGRSSRVLREEFPHLKSRLPTLWTNSYFVATVGGAPLAAIKRYVENQKNR